MWDEGRGKYMGSGGGFGRQKMAEEKLDKEKAEKINKDKSERLEEERKQKKYEEEQVELKKAQKKVDAKFGTKESVGAEAEQKTVGPGPPGPMTLEVTPGPGEEAAGLLDLVTEDFLWFDCPGLAVSLAGPGLEVRVDSQELGLAAMAGLAHKYSILVGSGAAGEAEPAQGRQSRSRGPVAV